VRLCCKNCLGTLKDDPEKYVAIVEKAKKAKTSEG